MLLFAKDLPTLVDFYAAAFGLTPVASSDAGYVALTDGQDTMLAVHAIPADIADTIVIGSPPGFRDDVAIKPCFVTDDLGAARRAIVDHGGQAKEPWAWEGTLYCECSDPEGNVLQVLQPGGAPP